MATIHLVEGPVGAGKSTFAARLSATHAAPRLILDEWMVTLFRPDRPDDGFMEWYADRKRRCIEQIWNTACDLVDTGTNVILELGLIRKQDREDFYARVDAVGYPLKVYVLDVPVEVRRQGVRRRNEAKRGTFKMEVSDEVFDLASSMWQPPDDAEAAQRNIEFIFRRE